MYGYARHKGGYLKRLRGSRAKSVACMVVAAMEEAGDYHLAAH
jgi:hypothetical protein